MTTENNEQSGVQRCAAENVDTGTNGVAPGAEPSTDTAGAGVGSQPFPGSYQEFRLRVSESLQAGRPLPEFTMPVPLPQQFQPAKQGYLVKVKVTNEQLGDAEVWPVSWDQMHPITRQTRLAEAKARIAGTTARLALAHPALHPVIELHSPNEREECMGCDAGDYAETSPDWPCSTIELILEGLE